MNIQHKPTGKHEISRKELSKHIDRLKVLEVPVEQRMSKEELERLHNNIHFTHQLFSREELDRRIFGSEEKIIGDIDL